MVTIFAWMEIRATYLDEDLHPEIEEEKIYTEVEQMIKELKYNKLEMTRKGVSTFIQFTVMENRTTARTEEMIRLFEDISQIATGSYGLLYYWDDELFQDEFRVLVAKKGKTEWKKDEHFSPCSKMIEEKFETKR